MIVLVIRVIFRNLIFIAHRYQNQEKCKSLTVYGKIFLDLFRLASPIWVGWAKIHTKTLLDVYLLNANLAV